MYVCICLHITMNMHKNMCNHTDHRYMHIRMHTYIHMSKYSTHAHTRILRTHGDTNVDTHGDTCAY